MSVYADVTAFAGLEVRCRFRSLLLSENAALTAGVGTLVKRSSRLFINWDNAGVVEELKLRDLRVALDTMSGVVDRRIMSPARAEAVNCGLPDTHIVTFKDGELA